MARVGTSTRNISSSGPACSSRAGSIYITFGSNGDINPNISRGTILRYDATTLGPQNLHLNDRLNEHRSSPRPYYLTLDLAIGLRAGGRRQGNIYFSTGNSDWSHADVRPVQPARKHRQAQRRLMRMLSSFTPSELFHARWRRRGRRFGRIDAAAEQHGGIRTPRGRRRKGRTPLPDEREQCGGFTPSGPDHVLKTVSQGGCWCGPAYYLGSDGSARVVTGGGNGVTSWRLSEGRPPTLTAKARPALCRARAARRWRHVPGRLIERNRRRNGDRVVRPTSAEVGGR